MGADGAAFSPAGFKTLSVKGWATHHALALEAVVALAPVGRGDLVRLLAPAQVRRVDVTQPVGPPRERLVGVDVRREAGDNLVHDLGGRLQARVVVGDEDEVALRQTKRK